MRILGIDPGLAHTGWGIIDQRGNTSVAVAYGSVSTSPTDSTADRLAIIHAGIVEVIEQYQPECCGIEDVFFGVNARTAFALGQARGVAILATAAAGLDVSEYAPAQVKLTVVGQGRADKDQVAFMVRTLLGLDHTPAPDHCSDALAVAITHAVSRGSRILDAEDASASGNANGTSATNPARGKEDSR